MGWWGFGITDGDTPQDILYDLRVKFGIEHDEDEEGEISTDESRPHPVYLADREKIRNADWATILTEVADCNDIHQDETDLVLQCMAMLYLEHELDVPIELRTRAMEATINSIDDADSFSDEDQRLARLQEFMKALETNKRDGIEVSGLFWSAQMNPRTLFD